MSRSPKSKRNDINFYTRDSYTIHIFNGHELSRNCSMFKDLSCNRSRILTILSHLEPDYTNTFYSQLLHLLVMHYLPGIYTGYNHNEWWRKCDRKQIMNQMIEAYNKEIIQWINEVQDENPDVDFTPLFLNEIPVEMAKTKSASKFT